MKTILLSIVISSLSMADSLLNDAMTMQDKGKPVEIISQALGHQSVETTKHYLAKFSTTRMAEETDIDLSMPQDKVE